MVGYNRMPEMVADKGNKNKIYTREIDTKISDYPQIIRKEWLQEKTVGKLLPRQAEYIHYNDGN